MGKDIRLHGSYYNLLVRFISRSFRYAGEDKEVSRKIIGVHSRNLKIVLEIERKPYPKSGVYELPAHELLNGLAIGTYIWIKQ